MSVVESTDQVRGVSAGWLRLREAADAGARSLELVDRVGRRLRGARRLVIHDLGCGTGSMGRWLAPKLPGPQHWIMYDRDGGLLDRAAADTVETAIDGAPVTVAVRQGDVTGLTAADLGGASLVTASALLDLLTAAEIERIATACIGAGCPALMTLFVDGRVDLAPADPFDAEVAAAFNSHQRRCVGPRRLLGPDAVELASEAFARRGARTLLRPSPWRLGRHDPDLLSEWFRGWLAVACEQRPALVEVAGGYADRRLDEMAQGRLEVVVHHSDLLML